MSSFGRPESVSIAQDAVIDLLPSSESNDLLLSSELFDLLLGNKSAVNNDL
jgi:hypothetical protein